jgi:hypothetical protein
MMDYAGEGPQVRARLRGRGPCASFQFHALGGSLAPRLRGARNWEAGSLTSFIQNGKAFGPCCERTDGTFEKHMNHKPWGRTFTTKWPVQSAGLHSLHRHQHPLSRSTNTGPSRDSAEYFSRFPPSFPPRVLSNSDPKCKCTIFAVMDHPVGPSNLSDHGPATAPAVSSRKRQRPRAKAAYPRKRATQACRTCRLRRIKCDNELPACTSCASLGIECTYKAGDPST